jgi:hypothetical protein
MPLIGLDGLPLPPDVAAAIHQQQQAQQQHIPGVGKVDTSLALKHPGASPFLDDQGLLTYTADPTKVRCRMVQVLSCSEFVDMAYKEWQGCKAVRGTEKFLIAYTCSHAVQALKERPGRRYDQDKEAVATFVRRPIVELPGAAAEVHFHKLLSN